MFKKIALLSFSLFLLTACSPQSDQTLQPASANKQLADNSVKEVTEVAAPDLVSFRTENKNDTYLLYMDVENLQDFPLGAVSLDIKGLPVDAVNIQSNMNAELSGWSDSLNAQDNTHVKVFMSGNTNFNTSLDNFMTLSFETFNPTANLDIQVSVVDGDKYSTKDLGSLTLPL